MESVPPRLYGGTERVVSYLTEELVATGHAVTLFASGDSKTSANLVPTVPHSLRLNAHAIDLIAHHVHLIEQVYHFAKTVSDPILHFHVDYLHFPVSRRMNLPHLTTMHGRLDLPDIYPLHHEFTDMPLVSISDAQRSPLANANWLRTVYHGLPMDLYRLGEGEGGYLAFVGRISPEKRLDRALEISKKSGLHLKIAAKIDPSEGSYFKSIEPLIRAGDVEFVGEINETQKQDFIGNAKALLFPIDWPEPFGLVMVEAMACGTPVIAFRNGSVPEVIEDGITGRIVNSIDQAVSAVATIDNIDRARCRRHFLSRFSSTRMAAEYGWLYRKLSSGRQTSIQPSG